MGVEFQQGVAMAMDLEDILSLHKTYLGTIFDRCFLNLKVRR